MKKRTEVLSKSNAASRKDALDLPENETQKLLKELQAHQMELEMQNDELQKTNVKLNLIQQNLAYEKKRYHDLFNTAPVGYMVCDCTPSEHMRQN
jgi:hypothetical protein